MLFRSIGGTADKHKVNIKDLRDLDAAFRLNFVNGAGVGWTHTSTGMKGDGTGAYANTFISPQSHLIHYSVHAGVYVITPANGTYYDIGAIHNVSGVSPGITLNANYTGTFGGFGCYIHAGTTPDRVVFSVDDGRGFILGSRTTQTDSRGYSKRFQTAINTNIATDQTITNNLYIGGANYNGTLIAASPREYGFATIGYGLVQREAYIYMNLINRLQITLGRSVD